MWPQPWRQPPPAGSKCSAVGPSAFPARPRRVSLHILFCFRLCSTAGTGSPSPDLPMPLPCHLPAAPPTSAAASADPLSVVVPSPASASPQRQHYGAGSTPATASSAGGFPRGGVDLGLSADSSDDVSALLHVLCNSMPRNTDTLSLMESYLFSSPPSHMF